MNKYKKYLQNIRAVEYNQIGKAQENRHLTKDCLVCEKESKGIFYAV